MNFDFLNLLLYFHLFDPAKPNTELLSPISPNLLQPHLPHSHISAAAGLVHFGNSVRSSLCNMHHFSLFSLSPFHSVTTVTQDHNYSINATKGSSHNSCNTHHVTERTNVPRRPCFPQSVKTKTNTSVKRKYKNVSFEFV